MEHRIAYSPLRVVAKQKFTDRTGGTITLGSPRAVQTGEDEHGNPIHDVIEPELDTPKDAPYGRVVLTVQTDDAFDAVAMGEWATAEFTFVGVALPEPSPVQRRAVVKPSKAALAAAMGVVLHDDAVAAEIAQERADAQLVQERADAQPVRRSAPKSTG